ncbi:hypothetical protein [Staphylococcus aureus]|nr:hypothetical protein [Staphylococcus aureus]
MKRTEKNASKEESKYSKLTFISTIAGLITSVLTLIKEIISAFH